MVQGKEELKDLLLSLAESNGLEPTENFEKILNAKALFKIGIRCPCDKNNPERYCISKLCLSDIEKEKSCHCNCWRKKC